jgi:hypothetical protein
MPAKVVRQAAQAMKTEIALMTMMPQLMVGVITQIPHQTRQTMIALKLLALTIIVAEMTQAIALNQPVQVMRTVMASMKTIPLPMERVMALLLFTAAQVETSYTALIVMT